MKKSLREFPDTVLPKDLRIGTEYIIVRRIGPGMPFEIEGPFISASKVRRIYVPPHAGHFEVTGLITPMRSIERTIFSSFLYFILFQLGLCQRTTEHDSPTTKIILPAAGYASFEGARCSLHKRDTLPYFEEHNNNLFDVIGSPKVVSAS